ncbi:SDR family oxidoreductase [Mycolicibacterium sphagni]|uniref:3-oxoacyl-[acyl-carrier-protein] reductase n=1 Tax=Mycolicibacterium sphagni TaxID=1786 RepID=A0A255D7J0_9MYCO|nr:SDR family NAD(P)-dependent oxidoreductase [Mycolicibacterium sphagni]MCV7175285.1 SDR family oxidoreductase [Mycolicibacterium sphagni]OYN75204.1 3-oxoacyl-[acyl-carrier-protein] reductase [Mycolicibacterium sphagni]
MTRVVVITGSASGIGRGMAERFAEDGCRVGIADINVEAAEQVADELSTSCEAVAYPVDVSKEDSVASCIDAVLQRWGRLDVLCANAGIYPAAPLGEMTEAEWDHVTGINLKGVFFCVKHAIVPMRQQRSGRIIVTASVTGPVVGYPGMTHYAAAKAGTVGLVRTAALELASQGITINAVMPGNVLTPGWKGQPQEYIDAAVESIPLKRLGLPKDIANAAHFFADERSDYITGQTLIIDGGQTLPETAQVMDGW